MPAQRRRSGGGCVMPYPPQGAGGVGGPINKGKVWISHGNNVITFPNAHQDSNYMFLAALVTSPMGIAPSPSGLTPRNVPHTQPMSVFVSNESATRGKVRIEGGFGFSVCGFTGSYMATVERFDDIANTQTARANATLARGMLGGYSLNGYGFASCGQAAAGGAAGTTERFDDVANVWVARTNATPRWGVGGYSMNGYGFTSCGKDGTLQNLGTTERFDETAGLQGTHTTRASATARDEVGAFSMNGYGFTTCGPSGTPSGTTERFDDVANLHTARASATARYGHAAYSMNGYGFIEGGTNASNLTERFDDVTNTWAGRATNMTNNFDLAGHALNGYGFITGGISGITERYDDVTRSRTARTAATSRSRLTAYATNEYFINYVTL